MCSSVFCGISSKKIVFSALIVFLCDFNFNSLAFCEDKNEEEFLFHEKVEQILEDADIDTGLSFDGKGTLAATYIHQNISGKNDENSSFSYEGDVFLHYLGKNDNVGYGLECEIKTRSGIIKAGRAIVNGLYAFIEADNIGKFNIGYTSTAADTFKIGGESVFAGYGGPNSENFGKFYNQSAGTIVDSRCAIDDKKAAKIAWFSPTFRGFSAALSYTLDSKCANPFEKKHYYSNKIYDDDIAWDYAHTSGFARNILTLAGKYEYGNKDDFNAKIAVCGWFGKGKSGSPGNRVHNLRAYRIGAVLEYKEFKLALGFTDHCKSLINKHYASGDSYIFNDSQNYDVHDNRIGVKKGADAGKLYSCGVSYNTDKLALYAGYLRSVVKFSDNKKEKATANITTVGAEYEFCKVFSAFAEYNNIVTKTCDRARVYAKACNQKNTGKNRANMLIIGSKISF